MTPVHKLLIIIHRYQTNYNKFVFPSHYILSFSYYTVFSRLNATGVYLKFGSFDLAFFRGRLLLMKCDFQPFFHVDLLLPILGNLGAVCQCWTIFPWITRSYSIMVPYIQHVPHVAIKICIINKQQINNI